MKNISNELYSKVAGNLEKEYGVIPFKLRGICITDRLIKAAMEILNDEDTKYLPQNCRNLSRFKCPDGLDKRIKDMMQSDLRTANIISDVLASIGVVEIIKKENPTSGRMIKTTVLKEQYY